MKKIINLSLLILLTLPACTRSNSINVTLHLNGGKINNKETLTLSLNEFKKLKEFPSLDYKIFSSYYLDQYYTYRYNDDLEINESIDLYAKYYDDIFNYELENGNYAIKSIDEDVYSIITVPDYLLNVKVNKLNESAFNNLTVKRLELPTIEYIEKDAFYNSTINFMTIGDKIKNIEYGAFRNIKHLKSVSIKDNPNYSAANNLIFEKNEGDQRTIIGSYGYDKEGFIESYTPTIDIINIAPYSFSNIYIFSEKLDKEGFVFVTPSSITSLSDDAFNGCNVFCYNENEQVKIQLGVCFTSSLKEIGKNAFKDSSLTIIRYEPKLVDGVVVPNDIGVEVFKEGAFQNSKINKLTLPKTLKTIEKDCFKGCNQLSVIYYEGTEEEFLNLEIQEGNEALTNAQIYYFSKEAKENTWYYQPTESTILFSSPKLHKI